MLFRSRLGWAVRPDSWLRFPEAIGKHTRACWSCHIYPFACSLLWGKKCLTDCSHYSSQCILTGAYPLKKKKFSWFLFFFFLIGCISYCWPALKSPADHQAIGFFPLCSLPCTSDLSLSLCYSFSSWTFFYYYYNFFFLL